MSKQIPLMKLIFATTLVIFLCSGCTTTIYLVRHAEKQTTGNGSMTSDPDLQKTEDCGLKHLQIHWPAKKITAVYATQYKRTQQTAEPTSILKLTPIKQYDAATGENLIDSLAHRKNKGYLVVGHSNTLLAMLLKLGLNPSLQEIPDNDFDNLFL